MVWAIGWWKRFLIFHVCCEEFSFIAQIVFMVFRFVQKIRREQREQQEKELLEKRQQFREATKNLLVFAPEEQAPKEKASRGRKVTSHLFSS